MSDEELPELEFDHDTEAPRNDGQVYKKWFRTKDSGGFLSVRAWADAGMLHIDIGATRGKELASHSEAYVPMVKLATYVRAVTNGYAPTLYPNETFVHYGGSMVAGEPLSRILKIEYWPNTTDSFIWKVGHFHATRSATGAYTPNMKQEIRRDSIKMTRVEMAELAYRLDTAIQGLVIANPALLGK